MKSLWLVVLASTLSAGFSAEPAPSSAKKTYNFPQIATKRAVIGSVADVSLRYESGKPMTVIHILEFRSDRFPNDPKLLQVRLCGNQSASLEPAVHTNITLIYNTASRSRITGCLGLISNDPWKDSTEERVTAIPHAPFLEYAPRRK
jgi:hypothetical protein